MKTGIGLPVFSGVAIGPAVVYRKSERTLPVSSGDPAIEQAKFDAAVITAREQLSALYEKAKVELGEEKAAIVEVQMLMLDDLGAEPLTENTTIVQVLHLLEERQQAGRSTVISTNLNEKELRERYTERVASRVLDRRHCTLIPLEGDDVRRQA